MPTMYWEDFAIVCRRLHGEHVVSAADILAFGREFGPQAVYTGPGACTHEGDGTALADGLQMTGWCMRMLVDNVLNKAACMGSPGVESLRWIRPVQPGDRLAVRSTVLDRRPSGSRPEMGLVQARFEVVDLHDATVMDMTSHIMFRRRPTPVGAIS